MIESLNKMELSQFGILHFFKLSLSVLFLFISIYLTVWDLEDILRLYYLSHDFFFVTFKQFFLLSLHLFDYELECCELILPL